MKTNLSLAGCSALTIACALISTVASADERQGPYFSGDLGASLIDDADLKEFPGASRGHDVKFDTGVRMSLGGGWRFTDWFRAGGEFGFIANNLKDTDATLYQYPFMAVVEFQLPNRSRIVPFIGGGPGFSSSFITIDDDYIADGDFVDGSASDAVFAWQAYGGLRYKIDEHISVGLIYKYFEADSPSWEVNHNSQDIRFGRIRTHAISVSFSMAF